MNSSIARRTFLGSTLTTAAMAATTTITTSRDAHAAETAPSMPASETYELRLYHLKPGKMQQQADAYFEHALVPALRRAGTGPVGVFTEFAKPDSSVAYLLIPHPSLESVGAVREALQSDAEYQKTGCDFLAAKPKDPAYSNLEIRLMRAPAFMPGLEVPENKRTRIFELRRYRSHGEPAAIKKLEMFGQGGEVKIFRRAGLTPVFFGAMLAGPDMPNVTYMLTFPDPAAKPTAWSAFGHDPEWKKLSSTPGYTDPEIITDIKSQILTPAPFSQI